MRVAYKYYKGSGNLGVRVQSSRFEGNRLSPRRRGTWVILWLGAIILFIRRRFEKTIYTITDGRTFISGKALYQTDRYIVTRNIILLLSNNILRYFKPLRSYLHGMRMFCYSSVKPVPKSYDVVKTIKTAFESLLLFATVGKIVKIK